MAKLFDSMAKLKFECDSKNEPTKTALGMWSKDGEYVTFDTNCECVGQVKNSYPLHQHYTSIYSRPSIMLTVLYQ